MKQTSANAPMESETLNLGVFSKHFVKNGTVPTMHSYMDLEKVVEVAKAITADGKARGYNNKRIKTLLPALQAHTQARGAKENRCTHFTFHDLDNLDFVAFVNHKIAKGFADKFNDVIGYCNLAIAKKADLIAYCPQIVFLQISNGGRGLHVIMYSENKILTDEDYRRQAKRNTSNLLWALKRIGIDVMGEQRSRIETFWDLYKDWELHPEKMRFKYVSDFELQRDKYREKRTALLKPIVDTHSDDFNHLFAISCKPYFINPDFYDPDFSCTDYTAFLAMCDRYNEREIFCGLDFKKCYSDLHSKLTDFIDCYIDEQTTHLHLLNDKNKSHTDEAIEARIDEFNFYKPTKDYKLEKCGYELPCVSVAKHCPTLSTEPYYSHKETIVPLLQDEYISDKEQELKRLCGRSLIVAPTGTGKTTYVSKFVEKIHAVNPDVRFWIFVPQNNLLNLYKDVADCVITSKTDTNEIHTLEDKHCIMMIPDQYFSKRWKRTALFERTPIDFENDWIITDETHLYFLDQTFRSSIVKFNNSNLFGQCKNVLCLTATDIPDQNKQIDFDSIFRFVKRDRNIQVQVADTTDFLGDTCKLIGQYYTDFDKVAVFSNRNASKLYNQLYKYEPLIGNSSVLFHSKRIKDYDFPETAGLNRTQIAYRTLLDQERLSSKVSICTKLVECGMNFRTGADKVLVVLDFQTFEDCADSIIQRIGRFRDIDDYPDNFKVVMLRSVHNIKTNAGENEQETMADREAKKLRKNKMFADFAKVEGGALGEALLSKQSRYVINDKNREAVEAVSSYVTTYSNWNDIEQTLRKNGIFCTYEPLELADSRKSFPTINKAKVYLKEFMDYLAGGDDSATITNYFMDETRDDKAPVDSLRHSIVKLCEIAMLNGKEFELKVCNYLYHCAKQAHLANCLRDLYFFKEVYFDNYNYWLNVLNVSFEDYMASQMLKLTDYNDVEIQNVYRQCEALRDRVRYILSFGNYLTAIDTELDTIRDQKSKPVEVTIGEFKGMHFDSRADMIDFVAEKKGISNNGVKQMIKRKKIAYKRA